MAGRYLVSLEVRHAKRTVNGQSYTVRPQTVVGLPNSLEDARRQARGL